MSVGVEASALADPTSGVDWRDLYPGVWTKRDPVTGAAISEDDELYGDPWLEAREMLTDDELDRWLGPANLAGSPTGLTADAHPAVCLEVDQLVTEDAWAGVSRVAPRPLPGVTDVVGPQLAGALQRLDLAELSPAQLVEAMTGAERLSRWAQSVQLAAVKAFADYAVITDVDGRDDPLADLPGGRHTVETGFGTQREIEAFCADGIGAALGTTFTAAQQLIDASYFVADVPRAGALLAVGLIDTPRLKVLARELAPVGCETEDDRAFIDEMLDESGELTPKKLEARLRTAVMAYRPDGEAEAHRREQKSRGVWVHRKPSGMATLSAYLTADEAQLAYQALNGHAWRLHDQAVSGGGAAAAETEAKSFDNCRADALMDVMRGLQSDLLTRQSDPDPDLEPADQSDDLASEQPGAAGEPAGHEPEANADVEPRQSARTRRFTDPARVMLHLYMQASTLAGLDQQPATLLGYGPIGADQARGLAEDAALTRILTDPFTKEIKAIDLAAYRVPKILRMAVQARDRSCVFPGCDVPAYDTQIDHIDPHPFARRLKQALARGRTTFTNLQSLCLRHHYLKTHGGWTIQSTSGSRLEWISPTGHSYKRNPEWGPPQPFYRDHHPGVPVDQPIPPPPQADQRPLDICPF